MNKEEIYNCGDKPLKKLLAGTIVQLFDEKSEKIHNDIVVVTTKTLVKSSDIYGYRIVAVSTKTGRNYSENMSKRINYKILKFNNN